MTTPQLYTDLMIGDSFCQDAFSYFSMRGRILDGMHDNCRVNDIIG